MHNTVTIDNFDVFLDLREQGFRDVIGGSLFTEDNNELAFRFGHSLISDYTEDDWVGTHMHLVRSRDGGKTWSKPEPTNLPGTGATIGKGLTLPDGSLLIGCRIPYSREYYNLPEKDLYGLNLARSFDNGRTWTPKYIIQRDPEGNGFTTHHCAMNGFFRKIAENTYEYIFGFFGHAYEPKLQRMLRLILKID